MRKKYYGIEFENDPYGIEISARNVDEAKRIVENPNNWKDGKARIVKSIKEMRD